MFKEFIEGAKVGMRYNVKMIKEEGWYYIIPFALNMILLPFVLILIAVAYLCSSKARKYMRQAYNEMEEKVEAE